MYEILEKKIAFLFWQETLSTLRNILHHQEVDEVDESETLFSRPTSHVAPAIEKNDRERWYGFYW